MMEYNDLDGNGGYINLNAQLMQSFVHNYKEYLDYLLKHRIFRTDKKYIVLRNDSVSTGLTASLSAGNLGQGVEIFHVKGASGFPVVINALNFSGLTGGIKLTKTGDTLKCVYDGAAWYLWSYSAASFAGATGATNSSVTFTTT